MWTSQHAREFAVATEQIAAVRTLAQVHAELLAQTRVDRDYWKARAERLIDAALVRAGAIHEPTMVATPPAEPDVYASTFAGMSRTELPPDARAAAEG